MHTAAYRANALLTYAGTALAILAALASLTGAPVTAAAARRRDSPGGRADLWHKESPSVEVRLAKVERLHALENTRGGRDDEVGAPCVAHAAPRPLTRASRCAGIPGVLAAGGLEQLVQLEHEAALCLPGGRVCHAAEPAEPGAPPPRFTCAWRLTRAAQVSLWDRIIEAREDATFALPFVRNKYPLLDQARALRRTSCACAAGFDAGARRGATYGG